MSEGWSCPSSLADEEKVPTTQWEEEIFLCFSLLSLFSPFTFGYWNFPLGSGDSKILSLSQRAHIYKAEYGADVSLQFHHQGSHDRSV